MKKNVHWRDAMNGVRFNQINVTRMFRVAVQWNDILLPVFLRRDKCRNAKFFCAFLFCLVSKNTIRLQWQLLKLNQIQIMLPF